MSSPLPWVHLWSLDELKPGWKTWARICRVHTLHPLLSLAAHPTSVSFDLQVLQRTSPPGSHGHFREPLAEEEVRVAFLKDRARIPLHLEKWGHDQEGPFKASEVNHSVLPTTSWSIFIIKKDLHANFRSCLCKECWNCDMKGNPERQGNGCGWLLMRPSSPWAVSPVSLKHTGVKFSKVEVCSDLLIWVGGGEVGRK